ncbi:cytochrome P450 4C1-like [Bradysia coprophila]|uniref:cytochrome P450 4C1-like n=1 Tax=Bradysia coprophila TaxID=38358 RepID=UPI00187D9556|nr:cytochrome P450 4C1-like [Bradysia coprophila]
MLLIIHGLVLCVIILVVNYVWNKRKFYYLSWHLKGPIAFPFIGNAWMFLNPSCGTINLISKLGHKYGPRIRFWLGSKLLVYINSPEDMETLINSNIQDKGTVYDSVSDLIGGHGLLSLNGNDWKIHRKLLNHTVQHYGILNSYSPIFDEKVKILIALLNKKVGQTVNIYDYVESAAAEIVCNTTFGVNLKLQQNENRMFLDAVNEGTRLVALKTLKPWYQNKVIMRFSKYHKISVESASTIKEFVRKIYGQKLMEFNSQISNESTGVHTDELGIKQSRNFIDECIRLTVTQKCFQEQDSINESITMLLAGFETTAGTVANAILMLAMHPEYQQKVYEEIENNLTNDQTTVTADVINQLTYTDRLIKETLRLFPIIPLITRITRSEMKIGKHDIPIGTEFILSIFDLHRKASIWGPDADKFDPNNFLPENVAQRHAHSFVPFSFGSRNCVGARYANIVVRLIVASLVRNFIFTTEEKYEDLRLKWAITLKLENGHFVKLTKRNFS